MPNKPKVKSNFLFMKPSDMFKMMSVLDTQTQLSNRAETNLHSSNGTIPEQLHEDNFGFNTEPGPELTADPATAQWQEGVRISEETIPKRVTVGLKQTAVQSTRAHHSSTSPLTKAELKHPEAIRYSRKDISSLDGTFPLDLHPPDYKGFEIQASNGIFSRKATSYGPEIMPHRSTKAVSPAFWAKEPLIPAWDGMLSWNISGTTTNPKPTPSAPKLKVEDIPPSGETLPKKAFSSGSQLRSVPATEVVTPSAILGSNKVPALAGSIFRKPSLGSNLEPEMQIPKPFSPPEKTKFNETSTKNPNRSDPNISPGITEKPARGGSGYSFIKGSRFPAVTKVGKVKVKTLEPAILKPVVTNNPEFDSQERMASWRKDETNSVKAIAPSFQVETISAQNRTREDPSTKVNPIVGVSPEIKSSESTKAQNRPNTSLPTLPYDVEESDLSRSSSDEGEQVKEATSFEDVTLVISKPWVKRITARRRMRQGEFSKW